MRKISFSGKKHFHSPVKYHPLASVTIDCGCNCSKTEPLYVVRWGRSCTYTGKVQGTMSRKNNLFWSVLELLSIFWAPHHPTHTAHSSSPLDNQETMLFGEQPCVLEMCKYWHLWTALHLLRASGCWAEITWERGRQKGRDVFWWVAKEVAQDALMETRKGHHPVSPAVIIFSVGAGAGG